MVKAEQLNESAEAALQKKAEESGVAGNKLVDLNMSKVSDMEVLQRIQAHDLTKNNPVTVPALSI